MAQHVHAVALPIYLTMRDISVSNNLVLVDWANIVTHFIYFTINGKVVVALMHLGGRKATGMGYWDCGQRQANGLIAKGGIKAKGSLPWPNVKHLDFWTIMTSQSQQAVNAMWTLTRYGLVECYIKLIAFTFNVMFKGILYGYICIDIFFEYGMRVPTLLPTSMSLITYYM